MRWNLGLLCTSLCSDTGYKQEYDPAVQGGWR